MNRLNNKVAIITGASKGIGASIARYYSAEGAKVVINYSSSKHRAQELVAAISGQGGQAIAIQADVREESEVKALF